MAETREQETEKRKAKGTAERPAGVRARGQHRLTRLQREYVQKAHHRWNIKYGATRSGKTYLDYFMIPQRIRAFAGLAGQVVLIGYTRGTLKRNILDPLADMYGGQLVSRMSPDGECVLFGERVYCMGADSGRSVDRLRGMSIKYAYGDEVASWEEEVFGILKSRLDRPYSCFDGTCNPREPQHWLHRFLTSQADVFSQRYALSDNEFLSPQVRQALEQEHTGVFYDRYILGKWVAAEGLVFPQLGRDAERFIRRDAGELPLERVSIGIDFGGYGSKTCMVAVGFCGAYREVVVLCERELPVLQSVDAQQIASAYVDFYRDVLARFGRVDNVFGDSASPTMIATLISAAKAQGLPWRMIGKALKTPLSQRPITVDRLLSSGRLTFLPGCTGVLEALSSLRWDANAPDRPEDKNIGNINDYYDAFCYSWTTFGEKINRQY